MTTDPSYEQAPAIPDKFYYNEVKREVVELAGRDREQALLDASKDLDLAAFGEFIEYGSTQPSERSIDIINSRPELVRQLWKYMNSTFHEAIDRRGYGGGDFREVAVGLCSASIRIAGILDTMKIARLGGNASTHFTNALSSTITMQAVTGASKHGHPSRGEATASQFAATLASNAFTKTAMERDHRSWAWAKVHTTAELLTSAATLREVFEQLPELSTADSEMLRRQNIALGEAAKTLVTYTPKPAIGKLGNTPVRTLFIEKSVTSHTVIPSREVQNLSQVRLYNDVELDASNVRLDYSRAYKDRGGLAKRVVTDGAPNSTPYCDLLIRDNNDLIALSTELRKYALDIGMSYQAEVLTSLVLNQNFDLIVPSYIVDLANEEAETIPVDPDSSPEADLLRRLLLARTRVLTALGDEIATEIDNETQEDEAIHRDIIKHGVIGHLRRLPAGYSTSPEARQLCQEQLGVEIPDGHTYVQIHTRGNIDIPSRGHKIENNPKAVGKLTIGNI